jgi:hypothetical protein
MSAMNPGTATEAVTALLGRLGLTQQTRDFGGRAAATMAQAYLEFRRTYYNESNPTLDSVPPQNNEIRRTQAGAIAERTLSLIPRAFRQLPLIRDIFNHLQWEVDIHSLTEQERIELHNLAMVFLHGVKDGIQPWYVEWVLAIAEALQQVDHPDYYLAFPWQGLFYRTPEELIAFQRAVTEGDVTRIQQVIERLGSGLTEALSDPLGVQPRLCFSGANGERRRILFTLKTDAALALGAYLAYDLARDIVSPSHHAPPVSVIQGFPQALAGNILPDQRPG